MKRLTSLLCALALLVGSAHGQWFSKTYTLASGWNGIWLAGDASHTTVAEIFSASPAVTEVWRWDPNPDQTQFTTNPSTPSAQSDEWKVWKRLDSTEQKLSRMVGNSAYLIRTTAATSVPIKMRAVPPVTSWLISGANFLGFPALPGGTNTLGTYFSSMIAGGKVGLPVGTKVYQYGGGELGATNPAEVPLTTRVDPDKAYWINYPVVSDFEGPVHYETPSANGLVFGRTLPTQLLGITNRATSQITLTFVVEASDPAPSGYQPSSNGAVPLFYRNLSDADTSIKAASGAFTVVVPASGRVTLEFGVDRSAMPLITGVYASILRIRDSVNLGEARLPVTAQGASAAGLWYCQVAVQAVSSTPAITKPDDKVTVNTTPQRTPTTFPLGFLLHIDGDGATKVLRQAFVGRLVSAGTTNVLGIAVSEGRIQAAAVSDLKPQRYFSPIMPYGSPVVSASSSLTPPTFTGHLATLLGSSTAVKSTSWTLTHAHNDPANPFVHTYHPDHDNRDAKSVALAAGKESYTVNRSCALAFTDTPPDGSSAVGWGAQILGGLYSETITGINRSPLQIGGVFKMRRISEISEIDTTLP